MQNNALSNVLSKNTMRFTGRVKLWRGWNWFGWINKEFSFYKKFTLLFEKSKFKIQIPYADYELKCKGAVYQTVWPSEKNDSDSWTILNFINYNEQESLTVLSTCSSNY